MQTFPWIPGLRSRFARNDGKVIFNAVDAEEALMNAGKNKQKPSSPRVTLIKEFCVEE